MSVLDSLPAVKKGLSCVTTESICEYAARQSVEFRCLLKKANEIANVLEASAYLPLVKYLTEH
jgi:hypothetical protein